jgi:hypothetical protein
MARAKEQIPAAPFAEWLNERFAIWARRCEGDINVAARMVAKEIGWDKKSVTEGGVRNLYRYRKQMCGTSKVVDGKTIKYDRPTETFSRWVVQEALNHAGVPIAEVYPYEALVDEFQAEYDIPRVEARRLADAWIEQAWTSAWEEKGRYVAPAKRPSHYCGSCKRTTRKFVGVCEECMAPVKSVLRAVA